MGDFFRSRPGVEFGWELPDGTMLVVTATHFTEDRSVGLSLWPEHLSIRGPDGKEFPLDNDTISAISNHAVEVFLGG